MYDNKTLEMVTQNSARAEHRAQNSGVGDRERFTDRGVTLGWADNVLPGKGLLGRTNSRCKGTK